ncbi:MAG: LamG domain-containing protein, partial [Prevotella sp.]|nr:LamG domain-containing protein [Bacteroidaceae bacterium]MBR6264777.1 LamG domain-containing protein [Prevotella sp.]
MRKIIVCSFALFVVCMSTMAQIAPVADLLDVVFNDDGTATDISASKMTVETFGSPTIVKSTKYGINILCMKNETWSKNPTSYFRVDYEENADYVAALADGHTLECLVRPYWEDDLPNVESKPFSSHQGGGTGLMICKKSGERDNEFTFLPNVTETGSSTWRWANSGVVPQKGVYYHLVGVYDKANAVAKIYVNGELKNTVPAPGEYKLASWGNNKFIIGGDPGPINKVQGLGTTSWQGDIALARIYDNPLTDEQVASLYDVVKAMDTGAKEHNESGIEFEDGVYQISTAEGLVLFAELVNAGETKAKAKLTADIDMTGWCDDFVPIGTLAHPFTGTFDGQEHTISNLVIEEQANASGGFDGYFGFVGAVSGGVVVENLILDNTCFISGNKFTGMVGASTGSGTVTIRNLGNEGDVTTVNEYAAGIIGCNVGSGCTFRISNCYSTGHIVGGRESAAISGWVGSNAVISSCWTTAVVEGIQDENHYVVRYSGSLTLTNTYSLYGTQGNLLDESTISTGALCFILNGDQKEIGWYQDLGKDEHPWPF